MEGLPICLGNGWNTNISCYPLPGQLLIAVVYLLCEVAEATKGDVYCCLPWMPSPCHKLYIVPVKVIQPLIVEVGSSHQEGEKSQASCSDHCKWCLNYVSVSFSGEDFEILSFQRERGWVVMYEVLLPHQLMPQFPFPLETIIDV